MINRIKVVLIGDAGVGKTFILNRYVKNTLPKTSVPTIGVEFATKTLQLKGGDKVKVQIWDTAGQERYRSITSTHYRRALGAVIVYDVTKEKSFLNIENWIKEVKKAGESDIVIIIVGNKLDLVEKQPKLRQVSIQDGKLMAIEHHTLFMEVSSISNQNIASCFEKLLEEIFKVHSLGNSAGQL